MGETLKVGQPSVDQQPVVGTGTLQKDVSVLPQEALVHIEKVAEKHGPLAAAAEARGMMD